MKKALSLLLTAALAASLSAPALAAEATDARLAAVTKSVKATLDLDTEEYEQFYGDLRENELAPTWELNWSGPGVNLNVTAAEDGTVLSYQCSKDDQGRGDGSLSLPKLSQAQAQETAQAFLDRVLERGVETARFIEQESMGSLGSSRYYFTGHVDLNGLPSPLNFNISVRVEDNTVATFNRDELAGQYFGGIPSPKPAADAVKAGKDLRGELSLRLEYVLAEDGKTAVLRYLPDPVDQFYVDGQTGKLVNLTQLYRELSGGETGAMSGGGAAPEAAMDTMSAEPNRLTQAEQQGVEKLEGVLSKEELGKRAQAVNQLGLGRYTLAAASYTVERADKYAGEPTPAADVKVTARLTYARQDGDKVWRRNVTLDAKSGELISVYSSMPWGQESKSALTQAQAQKKAEAFLTAHYKDEFAKTALYESPYASRRAVTNSESVRAWDFDFARQENGYFFPANSLNVSIDASDGSVSGFSRAFDQDVTFDSPEGIVTAEAAQAAYGGLFDSTLAYIEVPQKLDLAGGDVRPLLEEMGWRYFYALKLGWALESNVEGYVQGIDAKTGEAVVESRGTGRGLTYDDLDGHWVKAAAEALAEYGLGWRGGSMDPDARLNQRDLVALLVSTWDLAVDPTGLDEQGVDQLYQSAYYAGILTKADRDEDRTMTRMDIVKMLLDYGGYGPVAKLQGIYKCGFADAADIPEADLGYAALAQGLGVVSGDGAGNFAAGREATRAEAVGMLYQFMSR